MPATILGERTFVVSRAGIEGDRDGRAEVAFLEELGAPDDAYAWAMANPISEPLDILVQAFQVCAAPQGRILDAFVTAFREPTINVNLWEPVSERLATVEGVHARAFTGQVGVLYLYGVGDTVFAVWAPTDHLATEVIRELVSR